jgi:hypothetical protein
MKASGSVGRLAGALGNDSDAEQGLDPAVGRALRHPEGGAIPVPATAFSAKFICGRPLRARAFQGDSGEMVRCSHMSGPSVRYI